MILLRLRLDGNSLRLKPARRMLLAQRRGKSGRVKNDNCWRRKLQDKHMAAIATLASRATAAIRLSRNTAFQLEQAACFVDLATPHRARKGKRRQPARQRRLLACLIDSGGNGAMNTSTACRSSFQINCSATRALRARSAATGSSIRVRTGMPSAGPGRTS